MMLQRTSTKIIYKGDIVNLLIKAATLTPDYPVRLMCERKMKFLEQVMLYSIASDPAKWRTKSFFD